MRPVGRNRSCTPVLPVFVGNETPGTASRRGYELGGHAVSTGRFPPSGGMPRQPTAFLDNRRGVVWSNGGVADFRSAGIMEHLAESGSFGPLASPAP